MTDRSPTDTGSPATAPGWLDRMLTTIGLRNPGSIREDLTDALAVSTPTADFSPQERAMLQNVLKLRTLRVDDVMVPRADIVAVQAETSLGDLLQLFRTAGHSRLPVYGETLDDPRGMIHIRDFLDFIAASAEGSSGRSKRRRLTTSGAHLAGVDLSLPLSAAKILRPVLYAPPTMPAIDLLARMQATRTHMALVIDEYGGTDGLASIEDIVEMVVGNIDDEHDIEEGAAVTPGRDGSFIADARADLEEVAAALSAPLLADDFTEEVDTLGGLLIVLAGRVPARGEVVLGANGFEFEVLDADARRVKRVRIIRRTTVEPDLVSQADEVLALPPPRPIEPNALDLPGSAADAAAKPALGERQA